MRIWIDESVFWLIFGLFTPLQPHTYMPPFWALSIIPILTAFLILSGNILLGVNKKTVSIGTLEGMPRFSRFYNTLHNSGWFWFSFSIRNTLHNSEMILKIKINRYTLHNSGNRNTLHNSYTYTARPEWPRREASKAPWCLFHCLQIHFERKSGGLCGSSLEGLVEPLRSLYERVP